VTDARRTTYASLVSDTQTCVRVGVGVVVWDDRRWVLLERRRDCDLWGLPGGRIEPGESVREAALREVREETGLTVAVQRLVGVYSEPCGRIATYPDNGDVVHLVDIVLEACVISGKLSCSEESLEVRFFDPRNLPSDLVPPAITPLQDILEGRVGVVR
jgi:8-oxo-dGTP pyrophosphatase MutT (NUDIX family)